MTRLLKISFLLLNILFFSIFAGISMNSPNFVANVAYALVYSFFVIIFGGVDKEKTVRKYELVSLYALSFGIATVFQILAYLIYKEPFSYRYFLVLIPFSILFMPFLVSLVYSRVLVNYKEYNVLSFGDTSSSIKFIAELEKNFLHRIKSVHHFGSNRYQSFDSAFIQEKGINMILVSKPEDTISRLCKTFNIPLFSIGRMYEDYYRKIPIDIIKENESYYTISFEDKGFDPLVRLLDIFFALLILVFSAPIIIIAAILLKIIDSNDVFFVQERIGYLERSFYMYKLSTMKKVKHTNEYKTTALGNLFRRMRINELPQLWNVLKGEMSLVGPRPDLKIEYDLFNEKIPFYHYRLNTLPGITGHAQVYFDYVEVFDVGETSKRLEYDLYYVKNYSVFLYLMTILKSIGTVLFMKGK